MSSVRPHAVTCANLSGSTCATNETYTYDANGNLVTGGGRTFTWSAENQPLSVTQSGVTESYLYNADNERVSKTTNGSRTFYVGGISEETPSQSVWRRTYAFNGQVIAERSAAGIYGTEYNYLHGDHLGSVSAVSTSNASPTVTRQYFTPWGEARYGTVGNATERNYTGQRKDDSGLLFYNARYYDAKLSRFVSADPIAPDRGDPQTRNRYSYVSNNPLKYTDPTGHCKEDGSDGDDVKQCQAATNALLLFGLQLKPGSYWLLDELLVILNGANELRKAAGWTIEQFRYTITDFMTHSVYLDRQYRDGPLGPSGKSAIAETFRTGPWGITTIFYNGTFANGTLDAMVTTVHELAHVWDFAKTEARDAGYSSPSARMRRSVSKNDSPASSYARTDAKEDWAESVAATVFPDSPRYQDENGNPVMGVERKKFVEGEFEMGRIIDY